MVTAESSTRDGGAVLQQGALLPRQPHLGQALRWAVKGFSQNNEGREISVSACTFMCGTAKLVHVNFVELEA